MTKHISQKLIGYRVKAAREAKGWTQAQLSKALELNDRQSISDIENGKRALKPDELITLAENLEQDIEFFLNPFSIVGEAQFSWRTSPQLEDNILDSFELKAGQWIGILRWLREMEESPCQSPLKYTLRLTYQSSYEDASSSAERLVEKLDLGIVPAEKLIERIEKDLDIPILFVDTISPSEKGSISGATCHLPELGVIMVNRNEPEVRRYYDLAHELFHVLTWETMKPAHRESNLIDERSPGKRIEPRIEQLANNFAAALLMPQNSLDYLIDRQQTNDIDYLLGIAAQLHVAPTALAWRLCNLKWINNETLNLLKQKHQQGSSVVKPKHFSYLFVKMLHNSIDRGKLSARKAAKTMSMDLDQLSNLFKEHTLSTPFEL